MTIDSDSGRSEKPLSAVRRGLQRGGLDRDISPRLPFPRAIVLALVLAILAVAAGGAAVYDGQQDRLRTAAEVELSSIAELKVKQIADWRQERLGDAKVLRSSPAMVAAVSDYFENPSVATEQMLLQHFETLRSAYGYSSIRLVDSDGTAKLGTEGSSQSLHGDVLEVLDRSLEQQLPVLTDIHENPTGVDPHIGLIVPLKSESTTTTEALGAIVLTVDATEFLYPLILSWPTPSDTAETLLIRRDGDAVLFLNNLRFRDDAALSLRIPLTQDDLPAVMAVTGTEGLVQGVDYRGVEVLAVLKPIPDSEWFMVSKVDTNEVFGEWRVELALIAALSLALIVLAAVVAGFLWQRRESTHLASLLSARHALERLEWMLTPRTSRPEGGVATEDPSPYGDLTLLNTSRRIKDAVGAETLHSIASDYIDLLESSSAIYEANGDYALGIFASGWCRLLDRASRNLCATDDNRAALESGRWLCHESCWTDCSRKAIETGQPTDIVCNGGIRLYAVPILVHGEVVGAINVGYGDPPRDHETLSMIASKYHIPAERLETEANAYETRPPFLVELAKERLHSSARLIGALIERHEAERALRISEAMARTLFEDTQVAIIQSTMDGAILDCNEVASEMFGYAREDLIATGSGALYTNAEDRTRLLQSLRTQGTVLGDETELVRKDGSRMFASLRATRVTIEGVDTVVTAITDVTGRKATETLLQDSEQRYRHIADNTLDVIWTMDINTVFTFVNPAIEAMTGFTPEEWVGSSLSEHSTPEQMEHMYGFIAHELEHLDTHEGVIFEAALLRKDGSEIPVEIRGKVVTDDAGNPVALQGITRDITERKRQEVALAETHEKLRLAIECANEGTWEWDLTTNMIEFGDMALQMLGYGPGEIHESGAWWMARIHPDDRPRVEYAFNEYLEGRAENYGIEFRMRQKNGEYRWLASNARVMHRDSSGAPLLAIGIHQDIQDRKLAEEERRSLNASLERRVQQRTAELQAANSELESFAYSVAHDLRSPLRAMDGFAGAVLEDYGELLDDEGKRLLAVIRRNSRQMDALISDLLDLARISRQELQMSEIDMSALAKSVYEEIASPEVKSSFEFVALPSPPARGDSVLLKQMWFNLLSNAIKFTMKSDVRRIEVGGSTVGEEHHYYVRDTGIGFDVEHAGGIFGAFQRLHSVSKYEGTGIGLAIVERVAARHGGRVWAEAETGKGATFRVALPAKGERI